MRPGPSGPKEFPVQGKRSFPTAAFVALPALLAALLTPPPSAAQSFDPDIGEPLQWLIRADGDPSAEVRIPVDSLELTRHRFDPGRIEEPREELHGRPKHDLSVTPRARHGWKYPAYAVFGLPRDLLDGAFGVIGFVPVLNLPITGGLYEVIPTQYLFRDWRDVHRWGGRRNANGHGWIDSDGWGWFPTANSMEFTYEDTAELERRKNENAEIDAELLELNRRLDQSNREVLERRRNIRNSASNAIAEGKGEEAVSLILPYHLELPNDENAAALLVNALAVYGDTGPDWVRPYLWRKILDLKPRVVAQAEATLVNTLQRRDAARTVAEALVFISTRQEEFLEAAERARVSHEADPKDPRRKRLLFESALLALDEDLAGGTLTEIRALDPRAADIPLMEIRLAIISGDAAGAKASLAGRISDSPGDPHLHYYLACAELVLLPESDSPEINISQALDELERATLLATTDVLRLRLGRALSFTRGLIGGLDGIPETEAPKRETLLDFGL